MKELSTLHKQFGEKIKRLRRDKNLSQESLAEAINVDRSYMGFIERGERNPSLDKIGKIAKALKITLKELFDF